MADELVLVTVSARPKHAAWVAANARAQLLDLEHRLGVEGSWLFVDGCGGKAAEAVMSLPIGTTPRLFHAHTPERGAELSCGKLRQTALQVAPSVKFVAWLDDDDWQVPERLSWLVEAFWEAEQGDPRLWGAGPTRFHIWDTARDTCGEAVSYQPIFAASLYRLDKVRDLPWTPRRSGSDTDWLNTCQRTHLRKHFVLLNDFPAHGLYALHGSNTGNRRDRSKLTRTRRSWWNEHFGHLGHDVSQTDALAHLLADN